MSALMSRKDAVSYVEDRLGPYGSRDLAEIFCTVTRWQTVDQLTDDEWDNVLNDAMRREADGAASVRLNTP